MCLLPRTLTKSYESSSVSEFLAGAFVMGQDIYVWHNSQLYKLTKLLPRQPNRLFSVLSTKEIKEFPSQEPEGDIDLHFKNVKGDSEDAILVTLDVKFSRSARNIVYNMAKYTFAGNRARVMVLTDLSDIPSYPVHRPLPDLLMEGINKHRISFGKRLIDPSDAFFYDAKNSPLYGFDTRYFDPILNKMDWSRDRVYEMAVDRYYKENIEDLNSLSRQLANTDLAPTANKGLLVSYNHLLIRTQKAVDGFVEKAE